MNAEVHYDDTVSSLDGERGIPSVNDGETRSSVYRGLVVVLIVIFIVLAGGMAYWKTQQKAAKAAAQKDIAQSSAPQKTFVEPPPPLPTPVEDKPIEKVDTPPPLPPQDFEAVEKQPPKLDKAISNMMAGSNAANGKAEGHAGTDSRAGGSAASPAAPQQASGALSSSLTSTSTPASAASFIGNRNFILAKGSFIDCALQTRLDSTVAGMTACVITRNIYSDNGKILLLERGSTVTGEYQSNIKQGQARIGVLWSRIKTPNGVVIALDSLGTDALGGAGVEGYVDTHFWERFGSAIMLSLIDDLAQFAVNGGNQGGGGQQQNFNFGNSSQASQDMATEALKNTINIPPTLYKNQGEQIGIYVARDLDFSSVYDVKIN
jgi:type IV secretion system protein VirB10